MQSSQAGDWNVYSKYAVGWITPEIVEGLAEGESVDLTVGDFSKTGDAIIIPMENATGTPPFSEYLAINLFTDTGLNQYDAADYGLSDFAGVRIYHVDARMEQHIVKNLLRPELGDATIGTIHVANNYSENGLYNIELIQAGSENTLTDLSNLKNQATIQKEDFFQTGDIFTMEKYKDFFYQGLSDEGNPFNYSVEIVSIDGEGEEATATIRITKTAN